MTRILLCAAGLFVLCSCKTYSVKLDSGGSTAESVPGIPFLIKEPRLFQVTKVVQQQWEVSFTATGKVGGKNVT